MPVKDGSFLPRIQSVFYAIFDLEKGPMILYQVPEGLIGVPPSQACHFGNSSLLTPSTPSSPISDADFKNFSAGSISHVPTVDRRTSRSFSSPQKSTGSDKILFNFDEVSKYIIPPSPLCGRLVTCTARKCRVIGFPVKLRGNYRRIYFRYNLCFVFDHSADLSCYEPIVRKVSRVLSACEEESRFLSSPTTSSAVHAILEQLYEDLNSYSETHITIDQFNSIELKLFPFYPNPPAVKDWMVPLALINLKSRVEANWDLTLVKVCQFIDGINHVSRIAHLADCDLDLTRQAISHLLYYQVIMTIDIFQFSNMYTLRKSIQWLADESHVREECGPYVTRPGKEIPDWPKLLHLYSRLKPGKTVFEWMQAHELHKLGVDVRRFTSFGVIKGFLRRVHRWPVLLPAQSVSTQSPVESPVGNRERSQSTVTAPPFPPATAYAETGLGLQGLPIAFSERTREPGVKVGKPPQIIRKPSYAETILGEVQSKDLKQSGAATSPSIHVHHVRDTPQDSSASETSGSKRHSLISSISHSTQTVPKPSIATIQNTPRVRRLSKSPSQPNLVQASVIAPTLAYPPDLVPLLDGEHHTDELGTKFKAGWPLLERWLVAVGGGKGDGDFGRVCIIYR